MTELCVIGIGSCTAVGLSAPAAAAAVRSAISSFEDYPDANDLTRKPAIVAAPPGIAMIADPVEALTEMAAAAMEQVASGAALPVLLCLPEPRPGLPADLATRVGALLEARFPGCRITASGGGGHAGFGTALHHTQTLLLRYPEQAVAVVGVDSYLNRDTINWLDDQRQLHATYNAWGFIPGAAAGACLLCHPGFARRMLYRPLAMIEAVSLDREEVPIKTDGVCLGRAMSRIVTALAVNLPAGKVFDGFYCDQNGETYRADELGFTLARTAGWFRDPTDFIAPADCWGDVGAASLPLFIALAIEAAARGYARGPLSLMLAGSESGLRAGLRLRTPMQGD